MIYPVVATRRTLPNIVEGSAAASNLSTSLGVRPRHLRARVPWPKVNSLRVVHAIAEPRSRRHFIPCYGKKNTRHSVSGLRGNSGFYAELVQDSQFSIVESLLLSLSNNPPQGSQPNDAGIDLKQQQTAIRVSQQF